MTKKRPGRPKLAKGQAKGETLVIRLTKAEKQAIIEASKGSKSPSEWARNALIQATKHV